MAMAPEWQRWQRPNGDHTVRPANMSPPITLNPKLDSSPQRAHFQVPFHLEDGATILQHPFGEQAWGARHVPNRVSARKNTTQQLAVSLSSLMLSFLILLQLLLLLLVLLLLLLP